MKCGRIRKRVLAVEPVSRGFGFAVLEGPDSLVDWGFVQTRGDKEQECIRRVKDIIDRYWPDVLALEDVAYNPRRSSRIRDLLDVLQRAAQTAGIRCRRVSRPLVHRMWINGSTPTRHSVAVVVAQRFPELAQRLPSPRMPWKSEVDSMAVFSAVAMAWVALLRSH